MLSRDRISSLAALSLLFSAAEMFIPRFLPFFRLGLANTVTVLVFALISPRAAAAVSALRILLMGLLFGSAVSLFFSAAGGLLSFAALLLALIMDLFVIRRLP